MALNIKKTIKDRGLTINEVAERMGITRVGLSKHISGNPSVDVLERIANAIGCDISELFEPIGTRIVCPHCGKPINIKVE